jgi:hypothetical protein
MVVLFVSSRFEGLGDILTIFRAVARDVIVEVRKVVPSEGSSALDKKVSFEYVDCVDCAEDVVTPVAWVMGGEVALLLVVVETKDINVELLEAVGTWSAYWYMLSEADNRLILTFPCTL